MLCRLSFASLLISWVLLTANVSAADQSRVTGDVPVKVHRTTPVQFPPELAHSGITHGEAQLLLAISADGKLVDTVVAAYTHERFAHAALEAIRTWRFEAPLIRGETADAVIDIQVRFDMNKVLVVERMGVPTFQQSDTSDGFAYKPQTLRALDAIPTPLNVVQ